MPFGVGFMVLLMVVGGVAAYWGDRVGMLVGRRRLSIFGLRPKHTSRVVAVGTGVLIVLFTLTTLIIVSNSVRQALFGMDELQAQIVALSTEVSNFESKRIELEARNEELSRRSAELEAETVQLEAEKASLNAEVAELEAQIEEAQAELERASAQLAVLRDNLEIVRFFGEQVWNVANNLYAANFEVRAQEVLDTFLIDVTGTRADILAALSARLDAVEESLRERGLGAGDPGAGEEGRALRLDRIVQTEGGELFPFSRDEVLSQVVEALMQARVEGHASVIVQLTADTNARVGDPVFADFRLFPNALVYRKGEIVDQHTFDPTRPKAEIFEAFVTFVQAGIGQIARENLLPPDGDYGQMSIAEAYETVDQIARHDRPVTVTAKAARDIWAYGALELEFEISVGS